MLSLIPPDKGKQREVWGNGEIPNIVINANFDIITFNLGQKATLREQPSNFKPSNFKPSNLQPPNLQPSNLLTLNLKKNSRRKPSTAKSF